MAWTRFNGFARDLMQGVHNCQTSGNGGDTFKYVLTPNTPSAAWALKSNVTGQVLLTNVSSDAVLVSALSISGSSVTWRLQDIVIYASGGSVANFRYVIMYNDSTTAKTDPLIAWWDLGTSRTLAQYDQSAIRFGVQNCFSFG